MGKQPTPADQDMPGCWELLQLLRVSQALVLGWKIPLERGWVNSGLSSDSARREQQLQGAAAAGRSSQEGRGEEATHGAVQREETHGYSWRGPGTACPTGKRQKLLPNKRETCLNQRDRGQGQAGPTGIC